MKRRILRAVALLVAVAAPWPLSAGRVPARDDATPVVEHAAPPPFPRHPAAVPPGAELERLIEREFTAYDPEYARHRAASARRLRDLLARLIGLQQQGFEMHCSNQIYLEAKWLLNYTAHWSRLERRLDDLAASLNELNQDFAVEQSPEDGSWGACYEEMFMKLEATALALEELLERDRAPRYALRLGPRAGLHTLADWRTYARARLVSDISATGVDHRAEIGSLATVLSMIHLKDYFNKYFYGRVSSRMRDQHGDRPDVVVNALNRFIDEWQDPKTGYWGAWYRIGDTLVGSTDLSITFHIISYRRGDVNYWPRIIVTTLAVRDQPYPYGWLHDGRYNNHNNYDVAKILRYGWPHMTEAQRSRARAEIADMLNWTLTESLLPDGTFRTDASFFSSIGADFYFGVSFLDVIGYWRPSERFWTDRGFPGARKSCRTIRTALAALDLGTHEAAVAMERLRHNCGQPG